MDPAKLVHMANQIARNLATAGDSAPAAIAEHIRLFWDPRMIAQIREQARDSGAGLEPLAAAALELLEKGDAS